MVARMKEVANFILENNKPIRYDLESKYLLEDSRMSEDTYKAIYDELKIYRLNKSKELNIKPYFIYNNEEMERIIDTFPLSKEDFLSIKGFK